MGLDASFGLRLPACDLRPARRQRGHAVVVFTAPGV